MSSFGLYFALEYVYPLYCTTVSVLVLMSFLFTNCRLVEWEKVGWGGDSSLEFVLVCVHFCCRVWFPASMVLGPGGLGSGFFFCIDSSDVSQIIDLQSVPE